jgi:two-component system, sensor histidine kinase and response regulator
LTKEMSATLQSKSRHLMVVEDNPLDARILSALLNREGFTWDHVPTARMAVSLASKKDFDLILMDMLLPDSTGLQLFEDLNKIDALKGVPIIAISANSEKSRIVEAIRKGFHDYVTKPFHGEELMMRINQQLTMRQSAKELSDLNLEKARFFAILAHDIKSPFNALLGFSKLLVESSAKSEEVDRVQYSMFIHESAKSLHTLLENVLGWAAMQSGTLKPKLEKIEISAMVDEIFPLYESTAQSKQIKMIKDVRHHEITTDQNMASAVLRNLLSNALKFTPFGGEVIITTQMQNNFFDLSVRDTGQGMAESEVAKLFSLDPSRIKTGTAGEQGTGLGLALCHDFMAALGGTIQVESMVGQGTKFTVAFPLEKNWLL